MIHMNEENVNKNKILVLCYRRINAVAAKLEPTLDGLT